MTPKRVKWFFAVFAMLILLTGGGFWWGRQYTVPVLMYHKVDYVSPARSDTVSPDMLHKHIQFMVQHNYHFITLDELVDALSQSRRLPPKSVAITFDDGYENNYTLGFPLLKQYHVPATIFVSPGLIGEEGYLTLEQIREMQAAGLQFGCHGMTQAYLPDLDEKGWEYEIEEGKARLEQLLGKPVDFFAYPIGGFTEEIKAWTQNAGFRAAFTTNRGFDKRNRDLFELNRLRLSDKDNRIFEIWAKVSGYYNMFRQMKQPR